MKSRAVWQLIAAFALCASPLLAAKDRCGTRAPTLTEENQIEQDLQASHGRNAGRIVIPVFIHVITQGPGYDNGEISDKTIRDQINAMNETYAGERGGADTGFTFNLVGDDRNGWRGDRLPLHARRSLRTFQPRLHRHA